MRKIIFSALAILFFVTNAAAQVDTALEKKAGDWTAALQLTDAAKAKRVQQAIATHLIDVKNGTMHIRLHWCRKALILLQEINFLN